MRIGWSSAPPREAATANPMSHSRMIEGAAEDVAALPALAAPRTRVALGEGWTLWPDFALRGTGFPVALVLELASPVAARAADEASAAARALEVAQRAMMAALEAQVDASSGASRRGWIRRLRRARLGRPIEGLPEDGALARVHAAYDPLVAALAEATRRAASVLEAESRRIGAILRQLAEGGPVREAIAWSNSAALGHTIAALLNSSPTRCDSKIRKAERLVASYVQRFTTKNETIGFFGPIVWGTIAARDRLIACRPGPSLLARRGVWFEYWSIDALAKAWSSTPELRRWAAPRRVPGVRLTDRTLSTPYGAAELEPADARLLAACTGERSAHRLVHELGELGEAATLAQLATWADQGIVLWTHELPLEPHPERTLRRQLEAVEDPDVRGSLLGKLDELEDAKRAVAAAAGDAHAVERALDVLATTFDHVLGRVPGAPPGDLRADVPRYGARELVYEDCQRGLSLELGERVIDRVAPALRLLMAGHRWYSFALATRYRQVFDAIYDQLAPGAGPLDVPPFAAAAYPLFNQFSPATGRCDRPGFVDEVGREFQARWARVLDGGAPERQLRWTSAELAERVRASFAAPHAGWPGARHVCPDLMIAAASVEAIDRGDYVPVLGELHASMSLETFCMWNQHPAPDRLRVAHEHDQSPRVNLLGPKGWVFTRLCGFERRGDVDLEAADLRSPRPRSQIIGLSDVFLVREAGRLRVKTHNGTASWDILEFLDTLLCHEEPPAFEPLLRHRPRLVLDQLVFQREAWRFEAASDLAFAWAKQEIDRFVGARRWARERGLPRHVFVGSPLERKPLYVDFESPIFIESFLHLARRSPDLTITEMLPAPEACWLPDADGRRYACELRMVALDPAPWSADAA
jgi:Lantibiotic dehydratase, N terminus